MSSTPPTGGRLLVEPLEARIAPTGLTAIANDPNSASDARYVTYATQPTATHLGFVQASKYLGASAPANLYAIQLTGDGSVDSTGLSTGDKLLIFNTTTGFNPSTPFLQATNKTLIGFFQDLNGDGQVQSNELVGISVTKNSSANINGDVNGDIVTNLSKDGTTVNLTSVGKPGFTLAGLSINGNVNGSILAGGNINNVTVNGTVGNVFAGTATNGAAYHLGGVNNAATGTIVDTFAAGKVGASINGLTVTAFTPGGTAHAGGGGVGAAGGSINNLTVLADTDGFNVIAGDGGGGTDTVKGGAGGQINGVTVVGVAGATTGAVINLHAGTGGADAAFKGGVGGSVFGVATNFATGFNTTTNTGTVSPDFLTQTIVVHAGDGGAGLRGGRGGDVTGSSIFSAAPAGETANAEIQVIAGNGGAAFFADQGHGGKGGNVAQVFAEDQNADITNADGSITDVTDSVLVQAGNGGAGKDGGSLSAVNLLGAQIVANAGNGGDGITSGGPGGQLQTIGILNLTNLFTHQLTLNAGHGGKGAGGAGGAGGQINGVQMLDSDLSLLAINTASDNGVLAGDGGVGGNGVGGAGGGVVNVLLTDSDIGGQLATVTVRAGVGGNGSLGGGDGGNIGAATTPVQMFGSNFSFTVTAGAGGSVLNGGAGRGGAGGSLDTVGFSSESTVDQVFVGQAVTDALGPNYTALTGAATAGAGGAGTTQGGAGGALAAVDLRTGFDIVLTAGAGGNGGSGAGGDGGGIAASAGVSLGGAVTVVAGNGALVGASAAVGGSLNGVIASAQTNIAMTAGNGGVGGAGGDIVNAGTTANPLFLDQSFTTLGEVNAPVSNFGNVTITAGNGGAGGAGAGGSITGFNGSIGLGGTTAIHAGTGSSGGGGQKFSGAGGSVTQLQLTGDNLRDLFGQQFVTIDAGDAGDASTAKRGGAGGGVDTATIYNLDVGTVVQHVAAGDGANALRRGGAGGTITEIHVGRPGDLVADIGVRSGDAFGYAPGSAGGLFAGIGGTGAKLNGINGDVTNITANAISSIVAGKTNNIHLVNLVDGITLEGGSNNAPTANADGSFNNFNTANLVGSVQNPAAAGASTFKAGDGLIAATAITSVRNFTPEAILTYGELNGATVLEFSDLREPSLAGPVVTTTIPFSYTA